MPNNVSTNHKPEGGIISSNFNFIRNSGIATLGRVLGRGATYIAQIILARILAPDGFGLFAIGWTILRLFSIGGHLGLDFGIINFGSKYWNKDSLRFRSVFLFSTSGALISGLLFGLIIYISAPWLATYFFKKPALTLILKGFAFTFPFATSLRVLAATSSISGNMLCGGIAEDITQPILQIALFLFFYQVGMSGINAALFSTGLSYAIAVLVGLFCVSRLVPKAFRLGPIAFDSLEPLYRYSLPTIAAVTLGAFNLWGDRLVVGYFSTEADTGIYQSISLITMLTVIIISGIKAVMAPTISHIYHSGENQKLKTAAKITTRWTIYLSMPILLSIAIVPGEIINLTFGQEYLSGTIPLLWLTLGQLFYVSFAVADQFFIMTGHQKDWLLISSSIFILTITMDSILIPRMGIPGAAITSCATMFLLGVITVIRMKSILNFWMIDLRHLKPIFATLASGLMTHLVLLRLDLFPIYRLVCALGLSSFLYFILIWIFGIEKDDVAIFRQALLGNNNPK